MILMVLVMLTPLIFVAFVTVRWITRNDRVVAAADRKRREASAPRSSMDPWL